MASRRLPIALVLACAAVMAAAAPANAAFGFLFGMNMHGEGASGTSIQMNSPGDVGIDALGRLYVADTYNHRILKLNADGSYLSAWGVYGSGAGQFRQPAGVTVDSANGWVYVADWSNHRIQKFDLDGAYLDEWGSSGTANGQFAYPTGMALDSSGDIYVADTNNSRIQYFDSDGTFLGTWGSLGSAPGQMYFPYDIAIDSTGAFYVAEANAGYRVQKFSAPGVYATHWGGNGSGDGQFGAVRGIGIDSSDRVYVADNFYHRVQRFSSSGTFQTKWGTGGPANGQFANATGLFVSSSGKVIVADNGNNRIQRFDANGTHEASIGARGTGDGQFEAPGSLATAANGDVYVVDNENARVQRFDAKGRFIGKWGGTGTDPGEFGNIPSGVAIAPGGEVYVGDPGNDRVQKFTSAGVHLGSFGSAGSGDGQFGGDENTRMGIDVDAAGTVYVTDAANARIQKFDSSGIFMGKWGTYGTSNDASGPGAAHFTGPEDVDVSAGGTVWVTDSGSNRFKGFDISGNFQVSSGPHSWIGGSSASAIYQPNGIDLDSTGTIWLADTGNNRLQRFNTTPAAVGPYGGIGLGEAQFQSPRGIAVDAWDNVWIADTGGDRVQKLGQAPSVYIGSIGEGDTITDNTPAIDWSTNGDPAIECDLADGAVIGPLAEGANQFTVTCTHGAKTAFDTVNFVVDSTPPLVTISSPANGSTTPNASPSLDYEVDDAGATCDAADGAVLGPFAPGTHTISVSCDDAVGNTATATTTFTVAAPAASPADPADSLVMAKKLKARKSMSLKATCVAGCTITASLKIGKRSTKLKPVVLDASSAQRTVKLKLSAKLLKKVRIALGAKKRVTLNVTLKSRRQVNDDDKAVARVTR